MKKIDRSKPVDFLQWIKNDRSKPAVFLVEARGVEPLSENPFMQLSTRVVYLLKFPHPSADKQADGIGSFMIHFWGKA